MRPMPLDSAITKPLPTFTPSPAFRGLAVGNEAAPAAAQATQLGGAIQQTLENQTAKAGSEYVANYKQQQATEFQKLMASGPQGMKAYIQDVATKHPDLAQRFASQLSSYETMYQNPNMDPTEMGKYTEMIYKSWDGQIKDAETPAKRDPVADAKAILDYKAANPPKSTKKSAAEMAAEAKKAAAKLAIPGIWRQIEDITKTTEAGANIPEGVGPDGKPMSGAQVPLIPGTARPDIKSMLDDEQKKNLTTLQAELNKHELALGLPASGTVYGAVDENPSYNLYKSGGLDTVGSGDSGDIEMDDELDAGEDSVSQAPNLDASPFPDVDIASPKTKAEYDSLPSGTRYIDPNGRSGIKP